MHHIKHRQFLPDEYRPENLWDLIPLLLEVKILLFMYTVYIVLYLCSASGNVYT